MRYIWDEELGAAELEAHGYEHGQPELIRLGDLLEEQLCGDSHNLEPIKRLVSRIVQTSGRHTKQYELPPELNKHLCARDIGSVLLPLWLST